ncbi:MAG: anaerobic ribonucleoside-triphosphate reductase activating protein [Synergistaceae bacterium]|nr:anaerobic ribonucleoside-triphosphate reductase activating protein [Synergistaceae bacterium]
MLDDFQIVAYVRTSFLDWKAHVVSTVFTPFCNFACPWCNNGNIVTSAQGLYSISEIISDIRKRKNFLDGVCVSGGEPTLQDELQNFLQEIKNIGLNTKLDTNGTNPEILQNLIDNELIDFVAMDIKAPMNEEQYSRLTGKIITQDTLKKIFLSINILKEIPHEFRTTFVPSLHTIHDLQEIKNAINDDSWVIQCFKPLNTLDKQFMKQSEAKREDLLAYFPNTVIRG